MPHAEPDAGAYLPTPDEIERVAKELRQRHLAEMLTREPPQKSKWRVPPSRGHRRGVERGDV